MLYCPEIWHVTDVIIFHFGLFFALLDPNNLKTQNFEKLKAKPGDIIILHMCTINDNHMMYGSWDMKCDRQNFLSFWTISCLFTPITTKKIKILENWQKTSWDIIILHKCTKNHDYMLIVPEIWHITDVLYFILGYFCPFTSPTARKIKIFLKNEKSQEDIIILQ